MASGCAASVNSTLRQKRQRPDYGEDEMDTKESDENTTKVTVKVKARESPADQGQSHCATTAANPGHFARECT